MTQQPHATQPPTGGGHQGMGGEQSPTRDDSRRSAGGPSVREDYGYGPTPMERGWARGGTVFAGVLMLVNGILAIFQGISALAKDDVWANLGDYVYKINLTGWGVIMLVVGALAAATGAGILRGAPWARIVGIFLASLSLLAQFLFLPYRPAWSAIVIAIDFFVIWALAMYHPEDKRA